MKKIFILLTSLIGSSVFATSIQINYTGYSDPNFSSSSWDKRPYFEPGVLAIDPKLDKARMTCSVNNNTVKVNITKIN